MCKHQITIKNQTTVSEVQHLLSDFERDHARPTIQNLHNTTLVGIVDDIRENNDDSGSVAS